MLFSVVPRGNAKSPSALCSWDPREVTSSDSRPAHLAEDSKGKARCCLLSRERREERRKERTEERREGESRDRRIIVEV